MSELNLIPNELKTKRENAIKLKNYTAIGIIIFAVFFAIIYIPHIYLNKLISQEDLLTAKITSNSKVLVENTKILAEIKNYDSYIKDIDNLKKQRVNITGKIKNLQKYIPLDIILTNIDYSNSGLSLNGISTNYPSISTFAANLQMSKEYSTARIADIIDENGNSSTTLQLPKYKFVINITEVK